MSDTTQVLIIIAVVVAVYPAGFVMGYGLGALFWRLFIERR